MNLLTHSVVIFVTIVIPLFSLRSMSNLRRLVRSGYSYDSSANNLLGALVILVTAGITVATWLYQGGNLAQLGIVIPDALAISVMIMVILFAFGIIYIVADRIARDKKFSKQFVGSLEYVIALLPKTRRERNSFFVLCITAGVCEEIIYRGFIFGYLLHYMDIVPVVIFSSVLFGIAHAYQGLQGIPLTGAFGLALCLVYIFTGVIWAPMVLHAAIDIGYGYLSWLALRNSDLQGQ